MSEKRAIRFLVHFLFIFGTIWKLIKYDQMPPSVAKHKGLLLMLLYFASSCGKAKNSYDILLMESALALPCMSNYTCIQRKDNNSTNEHTAKQSRTMG